MINENIKLKRQYFDLSMELIEGFEKSNLLSNDKLVIGICGESGSGKSVTAKCLQVQLAEKDIHAVILHLDSYFLLPPQENHAKRKLDLEWVGLSEVNLSLLQSHIEKFKSKEKLLTVPVVDYEENAFLQHELYIQDKSVLIVEGVYSFFLEQLDYKIFMARTYQETLEKRRSRTREVYDPFVERVLAIEHQLISPCQRLANTVITKDYTIQKNR